MCGASIAFARAVVARHRAPRVASRVEPRRVATMSAPRVYVGKIPRALADDAIVERALEICGALKTWKRVRDPATRAPKRFGFATFETIEGAVRCARAIDGLRVSEADEAMTCAANAATRAATTAYLRRAGESALDADGDARRRREIARVLGRGMEGEEVEVGEISDDEATAKAKAATKAKAAKAKAEVVVRGVPPPPVDEGKARESTRGAAAREGGRRSTSRGRSPANASDAGRFESGTSAPVTNSATARFVRGGRHEYEATERAERLFREREKVMDDLVGANVRERARRAKIEKEKKMERRAAIKRDLASDSEEDGIQTPLWEKSDRERARRRRFRDLEIEDDERDRRDEEEELERRDTRATVRAAAHSRSTSDDVHAEAFPISKARKSTHEPERVRGFAEPRSSDLVSVPPPPQQQQQAKTSFGLTAPKRPTGGLSAAFSASHAKPPPDVFEDAARDVDRRRAERRPVDVAAIIATVPTARDDIFAHPMDWSTYTTAEIDAVASKWISKKLTDLLGESEPALARFVLEKLDARVSPLDLIVDLDPVLDAECEPFVISLWRLLIFEINKATMSS